MAMFQRRSRDNTEIDRALEDERQQTERLVEQLAEQAQRQQRKAIEGMIALPAAVALRFATMTLRAVAFTARGFEVFRQAQTDMRNEEYGGDRERDREREGRQPEQPRA